MKTVQHHCPTLAADLAAEEDAEGSFAFFRGIPYASVSQRWTQSRIQNTLPSTFDATKYGPRCPQPAHKSMITVRLPSPVVEDDEFACLNLNITVPVEALPKAGQETAKSLLPVMVFVHGGAFINGSNSDARYHPLILSTLAKEHSHPIVLVQIQYRLGVFGFVASSDLASEYSSTTSTSSLSNQPDYFANFGLVDQRNAFKWVQNHIQDFGGDPSNVTAFGVSAGSGSLQMHILSGDPLFDRAILMSGSAPTMGPLPLKAIERSWTKLCKNSDLLDGEKWEKKLEKLRSLTPDELMHNFGPNAFFAPVAEGKLFPSSWKLGDPHPSSRCKEVITGTTRVEAIMFDRIVQQLPQSLFHKLVLNAFKSASDADLFCKYFGFTPSEEQSFEAYRDAFRFFLTVVIFHFPSLRLAETFGGKAYLYHFEEPSPYEGPTLGLPVHGQCAVFVYNNDRKFWPESAQRVSLEMMKKWTGFAYGKPPWKVYAAENRFMRLGPEGECSLRRFEDDETRDYGYLNWLREHFDEALRLLFSFST